MLKTLVYLLETFFYIYNIHVFTVTFVHFNAYLLNKFINV